MFDSFRLSHLKVLKMAPTEKRNLVELVRPCNEALSRHNAQLTQAEGTLSDFFKHIAEVARLVERLFTVDTSLQGKLAARAEYDRVIEEAEQVRQSL